MSSPRRPSLLRTSTGARAVLVLVALAAVLVCVVASLAVGSSTIAPDQVWDHLLAPDGSYDSYVVNTLRLRRTLLGILVGLALAVAGALMQAISRNPLAEPGLLGVTSGASLAVVLGAAFGGLTSAPQQFLLAAGGALAATLIVYAAASAGSGLAASPVRLVLVGVAFSAAASAVIQGIVMRRSDVFDTFRYWDVGALTRTDIPLAQVAAVIGVGTAIALSCARGLTNISLGDDVARALGTNVTALRALGLLSLTLLCGAATAAAGPISFVGLIVPLVASWLVGPHRGWIIALSMLLGPALVLGADVVGRMIARPGEMQAGLLTAFVGSPVLLIMVLRLKDTGL